MWTFLWLSNHTQCNDATRDVHDGAFLYSTAVLCYRNFKYTFNSCLLRVSQIYLLDFGACREYPEAFTDDYIEVMFFPPSLHLIKMIILVGNHNIH